MYVPASLNKYIHWAQALPLLDIEPPPAVLPFAVRCPLCGEHRLNIYDDSIFGGSWGYCFSCETAGDLAELATKTWGTTLFDAVIRLSQGGIDFPPGAITPAAVAQYDQNYPVFRDRIAAFWRSCQRQLAYEHVDVRSLLHKFFIRKDLTGETWLDRGGRYLGACRAIEAAQLFAPALTRRRIATQRLFRGKGWDDILVIPFQDLPGRICGFLFIGRDGTGEDFLYRSIAQSHQRIAGSLETGLCMYDTTWCKTTTTVFGNTTFALDNVLLALRVQVQHLNDNRLPLPIVATYNVHAQPNTRNRRVQLVAATAWRTQPHRRYVFWSPRFSPDTISTASRVDGRVFVGHIDVGQRHLLPKVQLREVFSKAAPWRSVLEKALTAQPHANVAATLSQLQIPHDLFRDFLQRCPQSLQRTIAECSDSASSLREAYFGRNMIVESPAGWLFKDTGRVLCSAILRIERIIRCRDSEDSFYQGHIIYGEQAIPYTELATKMDKNGMKVMDGIIESKCGVSMKYNPYYNNRVVDLAKQFHIPEVIVSSGSFGWDMETASFVLPKFTLRLGGDVITGGTPFTDTRSPGLHLEPPTAELRPLTELCDDNEPHRIFWATAAAIGANVLAPALNRPTSGIGLVGQGANTVGQQTALALGCAELHVRPNPRSEKAHTTAYDLQMETSRHNWPTYVRFPGGSTTKVLWLTHPDDKNVLLAVEESMMNALALQAPWRYIVSRSVQSVPAAVVKMAHGILPHWLLDLTHRQLELRSNADIHAFRVLEDMAAWLERRGYPADVVRNAGKLLDDMGDMPWERAVWLVSLLHAAISQGQLSIQQSDFPVASKKLMLVRVAEPDQPEGIFVSRRVVQQVLAKQGLGVLDPPRITEILTSANALSSELKYNGAVGWLLEESWWQEQFRLCRARGQQQLRVVG